MLKEIEDTDSLAAPINHDSSMIFKRHGGWGGIRTHGTVSRTPVFKTGSLNHSDTHPCLSRVYKRLRQRVNCLKSLIFQSPAQAQN